MRQRLITGGNESESFDIIVDDTRLERVNKTKFLGVIIDENLTWKNRIDGITKIKSEILEWSTSVSSLFLSASFELCIVL